MRLRTAVPDEGKDKDWAQKALASLYQQPRNEPLPSTLHRVASAPNLRPVTSAGGAANWNLKKGDDTRLQEIENLKRTHGKTTPLAPLDHVPSPENLEGRPQTSAAVLESPTGATRKTSRLVQLDALSFDSKQEPESPGSSMPSSPLGRSDGHAFDKRPAASTAMAPSDGRSAVRRASIRAIPVSIAILSHQWHLDLETVKAASRFFVQHATLPGIDDNEDIHREGILSEEAMLDVVCEICKVESVEEMTSEAKRVMIVADTNGDGVVDFEEFCVWYNSRAFLEFVNCSKELLEVRELGHKMKIPAIDMDYYKHLYDKFDTDGSGDIDYDEFQELMHQCMKVPAGLRIPDSRLEHFWRECDIDGSGGIDLEEFIIFYRKNFDTDDNAPVTMEQFYKGIRHNVFDNEHQD